MSERRLGPYFHRKEQWDLWADSVIPWLCVHWETGDSHRRVFCLWSKGIQIGRWYWRWNKEATDG